MISNLDFCLNLLLDHFNPGGPINKLVQTSKDKKRPFVKGNIVQGFELDYKGRVRVNLEGIVIAPTSEDNIKRESFAFECFEVNCFESTLVETNIPISNICKQTVEITKVLNEGIVTKTIRLINHPDAEEEVSTYNKIESENLPEGVPVIEIKTRPVVFSQADSNYSGYNRSEQCTNEKDLENEQQPLENLVCDLDLNGNPTFYARGEKDIGGSMYFADFGYTDITTTDFIIIERNVPFSFSSIDNVLTAISTEIIPEGIKTISIKEFKAGALKEIGKVYGQFQDSFYFPHIKLDFARGFDNQEIDLEDLALNLLIFMGIKSTPQVENRILYRAINYSSPELEQVIINSFDTLSNLINTDSSSLLENSIPKLFNSFTKQDSDYNFLADEQYLSEEQFCFEDSCFTEGSFKPFENNVLINRSVDNRSIGWTVYAFASFIVNYTEDNYKISVSNLLNYLLNQKDSTGLFYKGWDQVSSKDTYNNSLVQNKEILLSTNISIFIALLKGFEVTQNFRYLLEASFIKNKIDKYFTNSKGFLNHSLTIKEESIESSIYSLLYFYILGEYNKLNVPTKFLGDNLVSTAAQKDSAVYADSNIVLKDQEVVVTSSKVTVENLNQIFRNNLIDKYNETYEVIKTNYLAYSLLRLISSQTEVSFINKLNNTFNQIQEKIIENREDASLIYASACMINNNSFLSIENNKFNSIIDFNNLEFSKNNIFESMLKLIPTDYAWFDKKILNKESNIGQILYTAAVQEALIKCKKSFLNRMTTVFYMYGNLLTNKAFDVGIKRGIKESDSSLKQKISLRIQYKGNTKEQIEKHLDFYNTSGVVKDNYRMIQAFTTEDDNIYSNNWGEGYLSGTEKASNLIYTINIYQPLEEDVSLFLKSILPSGIKAKVNEVLSFTIGATDCGFKNVGRGTINGCIGFRIREQDLGCPNIDLEDGSDLGREVGGKICREDEDQL